MSIHNLLFNQITESTLLRLCEDKVVERRDLEYKAAFPNLKRRKSKRDFLRDIAAFANTIGGDIIYGIKESKGVPEDLEGARNSGFAFVTATEIDEFKRQVIETVQTNLEPPIQGLDFHPVPLLNRKLALVIRVPRSFLRPHTITFQDDNRFFLRESGNKRHMDIREIRQAFLGSAALAERVRGHHNSRVAWLNQGPSRQKISYSPRFILHAIPFSAFDLSSGIDISNTDLLKKHFMPLLPQKHHKIVEHRYNIDGFLSFNGRTQLTQVFRNGIIESFTTNLFHTAAPPHLLRIPHIEKLIFETLPMWIEGLSALGVIPPVSIMASACNINNAFLLKTEKDGGFIRRLPEDDHLIIDRDVLTFTDALVNNFTTPLGKTLRPLFDSIWNAGGWPNDPYFDSDGQWVQPDVVET